MNKAQLLKLIEKAPLDPGVAFRAGDVYAIVEDVRRQILAYASHPPSEKEHGNYWSIVRRIDLNHQDGHSVGICKGKVILKQHTNTKKWRAVCQWCSAGRQITIGSRQAPIFETADHALSEFRKRHPLNA